MEENNLDKVVVYYYFYDNCFHYGQIVQIFDFSFGIKPYSSTDENHLISKKEVINSMEEGELFIAKLINDSVLVNKRYTLNTDCTIAALAQTVKQSDKVMSKFVKNLKFILTNSLNFAFKHFELNKNNGTRDN